MTASRVWLAQADGFGIEDAIRGWRKLTPETRQGFIIFGTLLIVTAAVFVWAAFIRKRGRRRRVRLRHHRHRSPAPAVAAGGKDSEAGNPVIHSRHRPRRRRHRHRRDRPRNPTLAETGGLPPYHTGEPPNPSFP
jgi:hypothetical protein